MDDDIENCERIWIDDKGPGIISTRILGGFNFKKYGLISDPEIEHFDLVHLDKFMIIATDGVWDVMNSDDAIQMVESTGNKKEAAEAIVQEAKLRWLKQRGNGVYEDISAIVIFFTWTLNEKYMKSGVYHFEVFKAAE
jgi:serine/threonine protein phosphatase PrpC